MTYFSKSMLLFLTLNLLLITLVSSCGECGGGSPTPKPPTKHIPTPYTPTPSHGSSGNPPSGGYGGNPPTGGSPYTPTPSGGSSGNPPAGGSPYTGNCPKDALKLGVCANVLNLLKLQVGNPPGGDECCPLIQGLIDADAAICLCTNIKLGLLGINLNIPVDLTLLVNYCGCQLPRGFQCF